ncbi:MAG: Ig-like domain-containing protein, partial [Deltaproteobacteria bacterium]|nr:Ig-like domain-containing protein [Deltaproteobacteria bacterium]
MIGLNKTWKSLGCRGGPGPRRVVNVVILVAAIACGPTSRLTFQFGDFEGEPRLKLKEQESSSLDRGLVVLFATPSGAVSGQPEISVSFNHPMKELGKADQDPYLDGLVPFKIEPAIKGEYRWMGSRTVMFAPGKSVPQATTFRATIPAGLRSVTGEVLEEDYTWTFETPPPEVVSSDPYGGEKWGLPDRPVVLYFNQKVDPDEVKKRARLTAGGKEVAFKVQRLDKGDRKSVRIVPKKDLPL